MAKSLKVKPYSYSGYEWYILIVAAAISALLWIYFNRKLFLYLFPGFEFAYIPCQGHPEIDAE